MITFVLCSLLVYTLQGLHALACMPLNAVHWVDHFEHFDINVLDRKIKGNNFNCVIIWAW